MTSKPLRDCYNATEMFTALGEMAQDPAYAKYLTQIRYWLSHRDNLVQLSIFYGTRRRPLLGNRRFIKAVQDYITANLVTGGLMDHDEIIPSHLNEEETRAFAWLADQLDPHA